MEALVQCGTEGVAPQSWDRYPGRGRESHPRGCSRSQGKAVGVPGDRQAWRPRECEAQLHLFEPGPPPFSAWTALAPHSPS